jgi:hypothetical protein
MRRATLLVSALGVAVIGIAGCTNHSHDDLTRSWKLEQQLTAQCRRWDAIAANAAHPDAATVARHDKLLQKAAELETAAVNLQGAARDAAIRNIAQAHVEAAAEYDAAGQRRIADQCWEHLGIAREEHQEMARELMQSAAELQSSASSIRSELPIAPDGLGAALIPVPVQSQPSGVLR